MDEGLRYRIAFFAAQLAWISALIHVGYALVQWYRHARYGVYWLPGDFRLVLFVVSGVAIVLGIYRGSRAADRQPYYLGGIVLMLGYVVGYFAWHYFGHRPYILWGPGVPYDTITVQWFIDHLLAGPIEFTAILVEVLAALLLAVLYVTEE